MSTTILLKRGLAANLPVLATGEPAFTTDTQKLYIGDAGTNVLINPTLGTAAEYNVGTTDGTIPTLGTGGKLDLSVIPASAITNTFVVASEVAMLALDAYVGDVAVRTDINETFILQTADPTVLGHWVKLLTPTDSVTSVNGKTGIVVLNGADIALTGYTIGTAGSVSATDTINQAFGTVQATLDIKAPLASPALTGTPTAPTAALGTNTTQLATTAFVQAALETIDGGTF